MSKVCFKCGECKPLHDFYRHPQMADGRLGKCKECTKADVKARSRSNPAVQKYDRKRAKLPHRRRAMQATVIRWRKKYPERYMAHTKLNNAVRDGKIKKGKCKVCGSRKTHGHHSDYSKPLEVTWLCAKHHQRHHADDTSRKA